MNMVFVLVLWVGFVSLGTSLRAEGANSDENPPPARVITGLAFSAVKFSRTIHIGRDGKPILTAEGRNVMVARDKDGRIFMADGGSETSESCDLPDMGRLPVCDHWIVIIFDPNVGLLWHWGVGTTDDPAHYVEWVLNSEQVTEDERLTVAPAVQPIQKGEPGVRMQDLGEETIQGIPARGVRTTTVRNQNPSDPSVSIHEVWTSVKMGLVLKVVDGDPTGDETVSGLDHISFAPAPALFKVPTDRILNRHKYAFFDGDRDFLANWLVH